MSRAAELGYVAVSDANRIRTATRMTDPGLDIVRWRVSAPTLDALRLAHDHSGTGFLVTLREVPIDETMSTHGFALYGIPLERDDDVEHGRVMADVQVRR